MSWWKTEDKPEEPKKVLNALCPYCQVEIKKVIFKIVDMEDYEEYADSGSREARLICCPNCKKILEIDEW
jgi:uncharacterized 2Fe-2S/4Fe-4S cluster protein (DUF4445 family)